MSGDGEAETQHHSRGVVLDFSVHRVWKLGELHDLVEATGYISFRETHDLTVEPDVFAAGELRMHTTTDLDEGADAPANRHAPDRGVRDPAHDLQSCGLS